MNIYGASGHAKVVINIIESIKEKIHHVIDDNRAIDSFFHHKVEHELTEDVLKQETIIAIGKNEDRKKVAEILEGKIHKAIIHSSAVLDDSVVVGKGTVVMANASVNADTRIGENCIINTGATVEHDCRLDNFVHISPNATLAGGVQVGEGTHCGIGAMVIPGVKIGKWVTIGAGAVIIEDVPDYAVVIGNPGKVIKYTKKVYE